MYFKDDFIGGLHNDVLSFQQLKAVVKKIGNAEKSGEYSINLTPSETKISPLSTIPLAGDFQNRYFFNENYDPSFWEFRGGEDIAFVETEIACPALSRLSDAEFVNLRPISGMSAMLIVLAGLGTKGSVVASISVETGGHYATANMIRRLGYRPFLLTVQKGSLNYAELKLVLQEENVSLIYIDLQNSLYPPNIGTVVEAVREVSPNTFIHIDASHFLGLILGKALPNPLNIGADSFGGSTHKTFPGPHKGVVFTRNEVIAKRLRLAQFDFISTHHFAETLSLGLAAAEFEHFGDTYAKAVLKNASTLAKMLIKRGFSVVCAEPDEPTFTHQIWLTGHKKQSSVAMLSELLRKVGIRANTQQKLPGVEGLAFRLGINEITFEGANETTMSYIADAFLSVANDDLNTARQMVEISRSTLDSPYFFEKTNFLSDAPNYYTVNEIS
jgi:glycine hydroxymethyltransferase